MGNLTGFLHPSSNHDYKHFCRTMSIELDLKILLLILLAYLDLCDYPSQLSTTIHNIKWEKVQAVYWASVLKRLLHP